MVYILIVQLQMKTVHIDENKTKENECTPKKKKVTLVMQSTQESIQLRIFCVFTLCQQAANPHFLSRSADVKIPKMENRKNEIAYSPAAKRKRCVSDLSSCNEKESGKCIAHHGRGCPCS